jgi:hypothetical protein
MKAAPWHGGAAARIERPSTLRSAPWAATNPLLQPLERADADDLASFQRAFAEALFAEPAEAADAGVVHAGVRSLAAQPAFAVYRNTFMKACVDALAANYPAVVRLVGEDWFRAAAAVYVRRSPPTDPLLVTYGHAFPAFLAEFAPAADYPYLCGVARLDRSWTEAHIARSQRPLDPETLATLAPEKLAALVLQPLPSARWHWFEDAPIFTLWTRNRADAPMEEVGDWHGEGALLLRPEAAVRWLPLAAGGCAFLDACAAERTLAEAAQAAVCADPACNVAELLANLLSAGAIAGFADDGECKDGQLTCMDR